MELGPRDARSWHDRQYRARLVSEFRTNKPHAMTISMFSVLILILFVLEWDLASSASPPPIRCTNPNPNSNPNPSTGGCTISNYLGVWPDRAPCRAAQVLYPRTEHELVAAVAHGTESNLSMKLISRWSQSLPKLVCPAGDSGLLISTRDLNSAISIDSSAATVTADAGVLLRQLVDTIAASGFALPAATYWDAVSVAGAISTGAHGSSLWGSGAALHDHVSAISLVIPASAEQGFAAVVRLEQGDRRLEAARVSLGVLGAISSVTFRLEPLFKRSVELQVSDDSDIEERVLQLASESEFGDICWHPALKKALFKRDDRLPVDSPGQGVNRYRGFQPMQRATVEHLRLTETKINQKRDTETLCRLAEYILSTRVPSGNGYLNDGVNFTGFPVVGLNNLMQTAGGCQDVKPSVYMMPEDDMIRSSGNFDGSELEEDPVDSDVCNWDPRLNGGFYHQVAFSVGLSKVKELIADIKKLREAYGASSLCGPSIYGGIYMRYLQESSALLGQKEAAVEFDITFYRAADEDGRGSTRLNAEVVEEIEQMSMFKYSGKPHWGKNRNIAFVAMNDKVRDLEGFLAVKRELDPAGLFSSEWSDAVLGISPSAGVDSDGCALEGLCICSEDRHCSPADGFFCRAGRVFEYARICSFES